MAPAPLSYHIIPKFGLLKGRRSTGALACEQLLTQGVFTAQPSSRYVALFATIAILLACILPAMHTLAQGVVPAGNGVWGCASRTFDFAAHHVSQWHFQPFCFGDRSRLPEGWPPPQIGPASWLDCFPATDVHNPDASSFTSTCLLCLTPFPALSPAAQHRIRHPLAWPSAPAASACPAAVCSQSCLEYADLSFSTSPHPAFLDVTLLHARARACHLLPFSLLIAPPPPLQVPVLQASSAQLSFACTSFHSFPSFAPLCWPTHLLSPLCNSTSCLPKPPPPFSAQLSRPSIITCTATLSPSVTSSLNPNLPLMVLPATPAPEFALPLFPSGVLSIADNPCYQVGQSDCQLYQSFLSRHFTAL
jgi:hypothetical protein